MQYTYKRFEKEVLGHIDQPKIDMRERHSGTLARIVKGADVPSYYNFEGGGGGGGGGGADAPIHSSYKRRRKTATKRRLKKLKSSVERRLNESEVKREGLVIK